MSTLTAEQIRFITRVVTFQHRSDQAPDDIRQAVMTISQKYNEHRKSMDFSEAAAQARTDWIIEFLENPVLPRAELGTVLDFQYLLANINPKCGLLVSSNGYSSELSPKYGVLRLKPPYDIRGGNLHIRATASEIESDFPYVDHFPQDHKSGESIRKCNFEETVAWIASRTLRLTALEDDGKVNILLPDGQTKRVLRVSQAKPKIAIIELI